MKKIINNAAGKDLSPGYVPVTHYMLWEGDKIVGWFRLRHYLSPQLASGAGHVGYSIREGFRGRGLAASGLGLLIREAGKIIPEAELYLRVLKENSPSLKVMLKNDGYIHHEDELYYYVRIPLN